MEETQKATAHGAGERGWLEVRTSPEVYFNTVRGFGENGIKKMEILTKKMIKRVPH